MQTDDNATLVCIPCSSGLVPSEYVDLEEKLRLSRQYEPVLVNEFAPQDRIQRRAWLAKLSMPYPLCLYRYAYGNNLGTLTYVWKIPEGPLEQTAISRVFSHLTSFQQTHSSRAVRHDFLQKYIRLAEITLAPYSAD